MSLNHFAKHSINTENTQQTQSSPAPKTLRSKRTGTSTFHRHRARTYLWHVGEPLQDSVDPFKIITHSAVGHAVVVHDLDPAQLVVGGINLPSKHLLKENQENCQWMGCDKEVLAKEIHTSPCLQQVTTSSTPKDGANHSP